MSEELTAPQAVLDWVGQGDWAYALHEAMRGSCGSYDCGPELVSELGVVEIIADSDGEADEANWLAILKLADGRFAFLSAGCDYTGWDCRASGSLSYAPTLADLCRMELDEDSRQRLGFDVFGVKVSP